LQSGDLGCGDYSSSLAGRRGVVVARTMVLAVGVMGAAALEALALLGQDC